MPPAHPIRVSLGDQHEDSVWYRRLRECRRRALEDAGFFRVHPDLRPRRIFESDEMSRRAAIDFTRRLDPPDREDARAFAARVASVHSTEGLDAAVAALRSRPELAPFTAWASEGSFRSALHRVTVAAGVQQWEPGAPLVVPAAPLGAHEDAVTLDALAAARPRGRLAALSGASLCPFRGVQRGVVDPEKSPSASEAVRWAVRAVAAATRTPNPAENPTDPCIRVKWDAAQRVQVVSAVLREPVFRELPMAAAEAATSGQLSASRQLLRKLTAEAAAKNAGGSDGGSRDATSAMLVPMVGSLHGTPLTWDGEEEEGPDWTEEEVWSECGDGDPVVIAIDGDSAGAGEEEEGERDAAEKALTSADTAAVVEAGMQAVSSGAASVSHAGQVLRANAEAAADPASVLRAWEAEGTVPSFPPALADRDLFGDVVLTMEAFEAEGETPDYRFSSADRHTASFPEWEDASVRLHALESFRQAASTILAHCRREHGQTVRDSIRAIFHRVAPLRPRHELAGGTVYMGVQPGEFDAEMEESLSALGAQQRAAKQQLAAAREAASRGATPTASTGAADDVDAEFSDLLEGLWLEDSAEDDVVEVVTQDVSLEEARRIRYVRGGSRLLKHVDDAELAGED